jgi:hypothetical protein
MTPLGIVLDDYTYMSDSAGDNHFMDHANARDVYAHLTGARHPRMPKNGPFWSQAKLDLFNQWMSDGFLP